jgi:hypothetical protein
LGPRKPTAAAIRSQELAHRIATEPADSMPFDIELGLLDPREAIRQTIKRGRGKMRSASGADIHKRTLAT